ncbi:MAG TPA: hypothetical protein VL053_10280 [Arachidicoccus sp.]|nr:hypothetical protein [Arachidicoccus sp.]
MKRGLFCLVLWLAAGTVKSQKIQLPADYLRDSLPKLIQATSDLLSHAYMAQKLIAVTDTIPGWEGYPVHLYAYQTGKDIYTGASKKGLVYLLNPAPEQLAIWILTTCWIVKKRLDYRYTHQLLDWIRHQSGGQFPVKGIVYEDQYVRGYQEPYLFKDGVTVYVKDSTRWPADKTLSEDQLRFCLQVDNQVLKPATGQYARICSTTREDYITNGGVVAVGDKDHRNWSWMEVVRKLYQKAWHGDTNELMIMWAKRHLK